MADQPEVGRVIFRGNPWPKGHAIIEFVWTAHVERSSGLWFDFHMVTEDYYQNDPEHDDYESEADKDLEEWHSKLVWSNYHRCTLSSTYWPNTGYGFLAGTKSKPLSLSRLKNRKFAFDAPPFDLTPPRPFHIYLLGHDAVASHKIHIRANSGGKTFSADWSGKIALAYMGSDSFEYSFSATVPRITFDGVVFPDRTDPENALLSLEPFVDKIELWESVVDAERLLLVPK